MNRSIRRGVLLCFFFSGASGLVYEVVWARQLGLFLGITSFAHTAVITAYMTGLALGSIVFGKRADRVSNPLRLYAWLEICIAVYAASTLWAFDGLQSMYAGLAGVAGVSGMPGHLVRFGLALAALLIPTFLMGGTLPLLVRGFVQTLPELGRATAKLYGLNTLGAMCGTLAAGYFLLPAFGITIAILAGVLTNLLIAFWILRVGLRAKAPAAAPVQTWPNTAGPRPKAAMNATRRGILVGFGLAGFASLLTQLAWIRALIMVVGGSVYAFTITLACFLAGIGLGSLAIGRYAAKERSTAARMRLAACLALVIAFALPPGLILLQRLPSWFLAGFDRIGSENFFLFQSFMFLLCATIMIVPTLLMGALFPLIATVWTRRADRAGSGVGTAYAINTAGTILGAMLGGLFILPAIGIQNSVLLAAAFYGAAALFFWWSASSGMRIPLRSAAPIAAVLGLVLLQQALPPWNQELMASGVYYRTDTRLKSIRENGLEASLAESQLLYYEEGLDGTVTVKRRADGERSLAINGKTDASSSGDLPTQVLLGQLPLHMNRNPREVMVIGLGSGITAGSVAADPRVESITVLEISAEVVEASEFFVPENHAVLEDSRTRLVTADARNFLLATPQRYDLIVSEPSNPWISGISNLFTEEFFALASDRLNDGGLLTQWFHTYGMSAEDFRSVLGAVRRAFDEVAVFQTLPGDLVIVASNQPFGLDLGTIDWTDENNPDARELRRAHVNSDRDLVRLYLVGGEALRQFTVNARSNSDRFPIVEFNAPRNLYRDSEQSNLDLLFGFLKEQPMSVPVTNLAVINEGGIEAAALGVNIHQLGQEVTDLQSAQWLIAHARLENGSYGIASQRRLTWKDADGAGYLQAEWAAAAPDTSQLLSQLENLVVGEIRSSGESAVSAAAGPAAWIATTQSGSGDLVLGLAWACANPDPVDSGEATQLAAVLITPSDDATEPAERLERFASRFECRR